MKLIHTFLEKDYPCGQRHDTSVQDIRIGSGPVHSVGDVLKQNGFSACFGQTYTHASAA